MPSYSSLSSVLSAWTFQPTITLLLIALAVAYLGGLRDMARRGKLWGRVQLRHVALFFTGWVILAVALVSPIDTLDDRNFTMHMVQHLLLLEAAPLFLLLGKPIDVLLVSVPRPVSRAIARTRHRTGWLRRLTAFLVQPRFAWPFYVLVMLVWHVPALYQETLLDPAVHLVEHALFFTSALLFWWVVVEPLPGPQKLHPGTRLVFCVTVMMPMGLLAALFTLTDSLWYPVYARLQPLWGLAPIDDQRLGGIIMWLAGSAVYIIVASVLFFKMMDGDSDEDREVEYAYEAPERPVYAPPEPAASASR